MRTTVEITDEQHRRLAELASRRRVRGFSQLVQEALDLYLATQATEDVDAVLALGGSLTEDEARHLESAVEEAWESWRTGS